VMNRELHLKNMNRKDCHELSSSRTVRIVWLKEQQGKTFPPACKTGSSSFLPLQVTLLR
jgi:hypothetical protein